MEQQFEQQETGVEEVQAAAEQTIETEGTAGSPDAGQQAEQPEVVNNEKDFAKALSAREAQIQRKLEQQYEEKMKSYRDPLLQETMEYYGYTDAEQYKQDLAAARAERQIQQRAQELGVDEDVIRQHLMPLDQKTQTLEQELQTLREQEFARNFEARVTDLKSRYPDFEENQDAIFKLSVDKRYELEDAYKLYTFEKKLEDVKTEAQRTTIQNIQRNANGSVGALGADAPLHDGSYSSLSPAEKKAFRERVKAGGA